MKEVRAEEKTMQGDLEACTDSASNVKDLMKHLETLIPALSEELVSAHKSLEIGGYMDFGHHVGKAVSLLLPTGAGPHFLQTGKVPDIAPAVQVVLGLSDGLFDDKSLTECLANGLGASQEAQKALTDLAEALESKNIFKINKALKNWKALEQNMPDSLKACGSSATNVKEFVNTMKTVLPELGDDFAHAMSNFKEHQYEDFGKSVGDAVRIVVYGDQPTGTVVV